MSTEIVSSDTQVLPPDQERGGLTDFQAAFVSAVVDGADGTQAALLAGYKTLHPQHTGKRLLADPKIQHAIRAGLRRRIVTDAASASINFMISLVKNEQAGNRERLDAAKHLAGLAGFVPPSAGDSAPGAKLPSEMTQEELRAFLAETEGELAKRATSVNGAKAADKPAQQAQDVDFIE